MQLFKLKRLTAMQVMYCFLVIISLIIRLININIPILESFGFRQTQTAITVQTWLHEGLSILNYSTPVFGFPYKVPFEFPIYQLSAYLLNISLVNNLDLALRLTNIFYFYVSAWLLYYVCKQLISDKITILIIIGVYLLSPFSIYWSRTSMIDFCSVSFGLAYMLVILKWIVSQRKSLMLLSILIGILAYLTKITSMIPVVVILGFYLVIMEFVFINMINLNFFKEIAVQLKNNWFRYFQLALMLIIPVVVGYIWVKYTDMVKIQVGQDWLVSSALKSWNYGTMEQKLSYENWGVIINRIYLRMFPYANFIFLIAIVFTAGFLKKDEKRLAIISTLSAIITIFCLFNLYYVHDYYMMAIMPYLSIVVGINIHHIFKVSVQKKQLVTIIIMIIALSISYIKTPDYFNIIKNKNVFTYENNEIVQLGRYLKNISQYDENVIITDADWSPEILYYSERKGLMLKRDMEIDEVQKTNNNYKFILTRNPNNYPLLFSSFEDVVFLKEVSGFGVFSTDGTKGLNPAYFENTQKYTPRPAVEYSVSEKVRSYVDGIVQDETFGVVAEIQGWGLIEGEQTNDQSIILELKNNNESYFFDTIKVQRKDVGKYFNDERYNDSGFHCKIGDSVNLKGDYKVNVIIHDGDNYYISNQQFEVVIN